MSATTIEWTDATWNPVRGCSPVSPGCVNCYAERIAARNLPAMRSPTTGNPFAIITKLGNAKWTGKVELIESKLTEPLRWRKPRRVFVNSMSDLFHENLPDESIDRVFAVMALTPHITYQVLTKRAERMRKWACDVSRDRFGKDTPSRIHHAMMFDTVGETILAPLKYPLPNVWLGVSTENQETADSRILELLRTPAAVRFISYEPALGPLYLKKWMDPYNHAIKPNMHPVVSPSCLDWIIAGGESGPGARPTDSKWFLDVRDQCIESGVPFFFKQWGGVRKGKVGAILDGQEWKQFPK